MNIARRYGLPVPREAIRLMRPVHYLKNVLIFLPLVFGHALGNVTALSRTLVGFVAFSLVASAVYIINDLRDVDLDRQHPTKRNRPLASGAVSRRVAVAMAVTLASTAVVLTFLAGSSILGFVLLAGYFGINLAYSFKLKQIPVLDVSILAVGFIIRVYYGGVIADIRVSDWLYLTMFAFSFFVSFGKRRNEILQTETRTRPVNARYTPAFLDKSMYLSAAVAIVFYALWTIDASHVSKHMILTVPLVIVIFLLYILRVEQPDQGGDPLEVILGSKPVLATVAAYAATVGYLLYGAQWV